MMTPKQPLAALRRRIFAFPWFHEVFADGAERPALALRHLLDLSLISAAVIAYCSLFMKVGMDTRLPGLEADVFQALDWVLLKSLAQGSFPLWNAYLDTGLPYIADPMLHAYNPLISMPVLLFGVWQGFKIALVLSFLVAAWGMYALAASLRMRRVTRVWLALMFCFAGQPTARFFQGQYLFVFGFAFIPWIFFGYARALETRSRWAAALTVVSAALLFFSGNAYYAFLMLVCLAIMTFIWVVDFQTTKPFLRWDKPRLRMALLIGMLSLLIISIQLLPTIDFLPYVNKAADIQGFHNLKQIFLDLTSKDSSRADAFAMLPAREEFYAYIGFVPFLGLLAAPLAWREYRKWVISITCILLFTFSWISLDRMPWYDWLIMQPVTAMFRHLLRALLFTSTCTLLLGALGFDRLIRLLIEWRDRIKARGESSRRVFWSGLPLILLVGLMFVGVLDLYRTNRPILKPWDRPQKLYEVMAWLRQYAQDDLYIRYNPNNHGHDAVIANDLRFLTPWYHYTEIRQSRGELRDYLRPLYIQPHYLVAGTVRWLPDELDWTLFQIRQGLKIVKISGSLPMAFTVPETELIGGADQTPLTEGNVQEEDLLWNSPNQVETIVRGSGQELLVILVSHHPDWKVRIDGKRADPLNVDGVLGVRTIPGLHKYTFSFQPGWFYIGFFLSSLGSIVVAYWLRDDLLAILSAVRHDLAALPQRVRMTISHMTKTAPAKGSTQSPEIRQAWGSWKQASITLFQALLRSISWQTTLFLLGLGIYIASRLVGLEDFPIYFFSDEAVQTVLAADLVRDGLHGYDGIFLPTYFENASLYNLSISVYLQVIPYLLFGKSVFVTRAVPALVTASAVLALGLILKRSFRLPFWWTAPFALGLIPTWFLHSRTAFETTLYVSFATWAFYFYLEYRQGKPWNLLPAMLFGALGFYSYAGAQVVLAAFAVLMLAVDWSTHRQHPRVLLVASLLAIFLASPYFRFRSVHPAETYFHFRRLDSYWFQPISPWTKVLTFLEQYFQGLSPVYWFSRNPDDLARHLMRGYGRISLLALPFILTGLYKVLQHFREPENKALILLMLTAPLGGALISVGITRVLLMVVPAAILISIGLSQVLMSLRNPALKFSAVLLSFLLFSIAQIFMLTDSTRNGPNWYSDYGLAGMQYGAQQVFQAADEAASRPGIHRVYVSPTWANGTDILMRFFLPDDGPVGIANAGPFLEVMQPERLPETIFILTASEYQDLLRDPKVGEVTVDRVLSYPNGQPGFYLLQFSYSPDAEASFALEQARYQSIQTEQTEYRGTPVLVEYPYTDMGELKDIFDGDPYTLLRFYAANPATIKLTFDVPQTLQGISITTGSMDINLTCRLYASDHASPREFSNSFTNLSDDPTVEIEFGEGIQSVTKMEIEITALAAGTPFKIHLRDIILR